MSLYPRESIIHRLLTRDNCSDNLWSVWMGADANAATQILNVDNSPPYIRQINVTNEMLAYDANLKISTEIYRLTWVHDEEPDANASYWLSDDNGVTKDKIAFSYRQSRCKKTHWWIFLKNG